MAKKPINFKAVWDRNMNPALKVASMTGFLSSAHLLPCRFACRIWFASYDEAEQWKFDHLQKKVGGRIHDAFFSGPVEGDYIQRRLGQFRLEMEMAGRGHRISPPIIERYEILRDALITDGFKIDWQGDLPYPRIYRTRDAFEDGIKLASRPIRDPRVPD